MALAQPTFSDLEASSGRTTRRRRFLELLDSRIPWDAWAARVEPFYPRAGGGRPPVPLRTMLRMYVAQVAFQLSDEGAEDALWDSAAVRSFVGCGDAVPDATTCRSSSSATRRSAGRPRRPPGRPSRRPRSAAGRARSRCSPTRKSPARAAGSAPSRPRCPRGGCRGTSWSRSRRSRPPGRRRSSSWRASRFRTR